MSEKQKWRFQKHERGSAFFETSKTFIVRGMGQLFLWFGVEGLFGKLNFLKYINNSDLSSNIFKKQQSVEFKLSVNKESVLILLIRTKRAQNM